MSWWGFKPYVSVAQRHANAKRHVAKLQKKGQTCTPIQIEGRTIACTFWGNAWCDNLESYSDFANRLPRGRTYVRNGSVIDLQINPGRVTALVSGSEVYEIDIKIKPIAPKVWGDVKLRCAGQIGSLVELLQGRLSKGVMEIVTAREVGLFPKPAEIELDCSCPDWADMCKHVAAVLYGVGAKLDEQPELLFTLRKVDHLELIAKAGDATALPSGKPSSRKRLATGALSDVFGIELASADLPPKAEVPTPVPQADTAAKATRKKPSGVRGKGRASKNEKRENSPTKPARARAQAQR